MRLGLALAATAGTLACVGQSPIDTAVNDSLAVPITQLVIASYKGLPGGLYPGSNDPPPAHAAEGVSRAQTVEPVDTAGNASAAGKYVLLSVGIGNAAQEFCSANGAPPCDSWTFAGQAAADQGVNHGTLAIVNGAASGQTADTWESPTAPNYDRIRDTRLSPLGLSEKQVQVVWLKVASSAPGDSLPNPDADAYVLERRMGNIVRALRTRYLTLKLVLVSSRIWGGYSTVAADGEPYAYESGFAVKWLVQAQIDQMAAGAVQDTVAGNLDYHSAAPWIGWGPYLWAYGNLVRSDGLNWLHSDFQTDGFSPSQSGEQKVGEQLMGFLSLQRFTRCWFRVGEMCS
jgi:hypothetical protein